MIRKLIIVVLAIIGIAALLYFGIDWIEAGLGNLKDKAAEYYEDLKEVPEKIDEITDNIKKPVSSGDQR